MNTAMNFLIAVQVNRQNEKKGQCEAFSRSSEVMAEDKKQRNQIEKTNADNNHASEQVQFSAVLQR